MLLSLLLHGDAAASGGFLGYDAPRLHAALNDFPPAVLIVAVGFELAYLFSRKDGFRQVAFYTLVVGAVMTAAAVISGLRAEDAIEHGDAIHEIMETHERLGYITLGVFAVLAIWRLLREKKMARAERWAAAVAGIIGLGFVVATSREGGEMVYEHAAGIPTSVLQAEMMNREAGHSHEGGEEHEHAAPADSMAPRDSTIPIDSAAAAPAAPHTHAPGTPEHKD
ncbi:MAG TPA: DUF2231 domain-containing protein [Gemmatimonadales bacterium]|nr:DUF2231 domain-containing protein [Gemmatimonadales bacterium]